VFCNLHKKGGGRGEKKREKREKEGGSPHRSGELYGKNQRRPPIRLHYASSFSLGEEIAVDEQRGGGKGGRKREGKEEGENSFFADRRGKIKERVTKWRRGVRPCTIFSPLFLKYLTAQ